MPFKQVIVVRTDLKMSKGKIAAQCGHAVIESFLRAQEKTPDNVLAWLAEGQAKVVLKVDSRQQLFHLYQKVRKKLPCALINDAGLTQLKQGTATCLGIGPAPEKEIDVFTKDLKLL